MTASRRIFLNVVATYGRSLYALVIGLFCGRWMLMALGEVDYGLIGVVGGLLGFVEFLNRLMSESVSRFYAYSVGAASRAENADAGLRECREWFSLAVVIHVAVPTVLMLFGYPIGKWAILHYLTIPADHLDACVWVWRFSCMSCFVGMVSVPFCAMYYAKQEIAELTIYGFVTTTLNAVFLGYAVQHPGEWLVAYSAWMNLLVVAPNLIMTIRAGLIYRECRWTWGVLQRFDKGRRLLAYAGGRFIIALAQVIEGHGMSILVNKCFGPVQNAAMTVGNSVSSRCLTLSASFAGAFSPAITNAAGANDLEGMRKLAFRNCRFSTLAVLIFAIPLMLEAETVLLLWLKDPPSESTSLCVCMLIAAVIDKLTQGHWVSIYAIGKIAKYNAVESIAWFLVLPLSYAFFKCGMGVLGAGVGYACGHVLALCVKLHFGSVIAGLSQRHWLRHILMPIGGACLLSLVVGAGVVMLLSASLSRVVVTTIAVEVVFLSLAWIWVLNDEERLFLRHRIALLRERLGGYYHGK